MMELAYFLAGDTDSQGHPGHASSFGRFRVTTKNSTAGMLIAGMWLRSDNEGHFRLGDPARAEPGKVTQCFEGADSVSGFAGASSWPFQLVSAGQGRKRLTHKVRSSSAPLRGVCVP